MARDKKGNKKIPCVVREFFANLTKLFNSNFNCLFYSFVVSIFYCNCNLVSTFLSTFLYIDLSVFNFNLRIVALIGCLTSFLSYFQSCRLSCFFNFRSFYCVRAPRNFYSLFCLFNCISTFPSLSSILSKTCYFYNMFSGSFV